MHISFTCFSSDNIIYPIWFVWSCFYCRLQREFATLISYIYVWKLAGMRPIPSVFLWFSCSLTKVSPSADSAAFPHHNRKNSDPIINWNEGPAPLGSFSSRCTDAEPWPASVKWNAPVFNWTNCTLVFSVSCNEGLKRLEIAAQRGNQTEGGVMAVLNQIYFDNSWNNQSSSFGIWVAGPVAPTGVSCLVTPSSDCAGAAGLHVMRLVVCGSHLCLIIRRVICFSTPTFIFLLLL